MQTLLTQLESQSCHKPYGFSYENVNEIAFTTLLKCAQCNLVYERRVSKLDLVNQMHPKMHEWFFEDQARDAFLFIPCTYEEPFG